MIPSLTSTRQPCAIFSVDNGNYNGSGSPADEVPCPVPVRDWRGSSTFASPDGADLAESTRAVLSARRPTESQVNNASTPFSPAGESLGVSMHQDSVATSLATNSRARILLRSNTACYPDSVSKGPQSVAARLAGGWGAEAMDEQQIPESSTVPESGKLLSASSQASALHAILDSTFSSSRQSSPSRRSSPLRNAVGVSPGVKTRPSTASRLGGATLPDLGEAHQGAATNARDYSKHDIGGPKMVQVLVMGHGGTRNVQPVARFESPTRGEHRTNGTRGESSALVTQHRRTPESIGSNASSLSSTSSYGSQCSGMKPEGDLDLVPILGSHHQNGGNAAQGNRLGGGAHAVVHGGGGSLAGTAAQQHMTMAHGGMAPNFALMSGSRFSPLQTSEACGGQKILFPGSPNSVLGRLRSDVIAMSADSGSSFAETEDSTVEEGPCEPLSAPEPCSNWEEVEALCESMDLANVPIELIDIKFDSEDGEAERPHDRLGAGTSTSLMAIKFEGISNWQCPGHQVEDKKFQKVIRCL